MDLVSDPGRVRDLTEAIAAGSLTSETLVKRYLGRIRDVDDSVQAWTDVLVDEAIAAAKALDVERGAIGMRGPLHGIPIAVKDIMDVAGLPTRANSASRADAPPATADATVVAHLRARGAIILGKVHTTEFAYFESIPPTRNPHDLARTPGGSSAGSSAAVAAGMVPLALGTQTAGSVNRPAAYTGIGAFKPSTRSIGGAGVVSLAPTYDTVGAFGSTAEDAALLAAAFAPEQLRLGDAELPEVRRIVLLEDALIKEKAAVSTMAAVKALADRLGQAGFTVEPAATPVPLDELIADHRTVLWFEMARIHGAAPRHLLSQRFAEDVEKGLALCTDEYHAALNRLAAGRSRFWEQFGARVFILMPAAPDIAPADGTTGDPSFVIPTTVLGGPVATVRAGQDVPTGMPIGAMLFAAPGTDGMLASMLLSDRVKDIGL